MVSSLSVESMLYVTELVHQSFDVTLLVKMSSNETKITEGVWSYVDEQIHELWSMVDIGLGGGARCVRATCPRPWTEPGGEYEFG